MAQRLASRLRGAQAGWGPATASRDFVMIRTFMAASGEREVTVHSVHRQPVRPGVTGPTGPPPPEIGSLPQQGGAASVAKHGFVLSASVTQRPAQSPDVEWKRSDATPRGAAPVMMSARRLRDPFCRRGRSIAPLPAGVRPTPLSLAKRELNRVGAADDSVEAAACHESSGYVGYRSDDRSSARRQIDDCVARSPDAGGTRRLARADRASTSAAGCRIAPDVIPQCSGTRTSVSPAPDGRQRTETPMKTFRVVADMDRSPRVHASRIASCNVCCNSYSKLVQLL